MSNVALEVGMHAYNVTDSFVNDGMWKIGSKSDSHTRKICEGLEGEGGEGNGTPLQYACLENPMAGGAW